MNYDKYKLNVKEWIILIISYLLIISMVAYIFYDSVICVLILLPAIIAYIKIFRIKKLGNLKENLDREFLEALGSLSASLAAGLSPENAFIEAEEDMIRLYGIRSLIVRELMIINRKVKAKGGLSDALYDFAKRSNSQAIEDFAIVFNVASNCGGGFTKVIQNCVTVMETDRQIKEEARVLIRGKQFEQKIMSVIPIGIILYLRLSSGGFMNVLYHNILGVTVMSICLFMYVLSLYVSDRICLVTV